MKLPFSLERSLVICAQRSTVFRYFTASGRFADWWGAGSQIDARPGGEIVIRYPNGVAARGTVVELVPGERIVFTYGYDSGAPIAPGESRVTITLQDHRRGTRLELRHDVADAATRDAHVPGWRYQLALFANIVTLEQHAGLGAIVDRFFTAWSESDPTRRYAVLAEAVTPDIEFRDAFSCVQGLEDLHGHISALQIHMPGATVTREGDVRHCQGTALVGWVSRGQDGKVLGSGSNVIDLAPDGRIRRVVGLWRPAAR
jgi:uncharacterized protein YndB with AHSA1/START domain